MSKIKINNTAGLVPTTNHIGTDQIGVNTADGKIFVNDGTKVAVISDPVVTGSIKKSEFLGLAEQRKREYAGSGFAEWGKVRTGTGITSVNEGIWALPTNASYVDTLSIGRLNGDGSSRVDFPIAIVDGVEHTLFGTADTTADVPNQFEFLFPPAPDGTKTYDSATGTVTQHTNAEVAFASETATNKVITSRKDLVFLESWHERIADKDIVYPLGNVQYGGTTFDGIAMDLSPSGIAQGYSAFGEWDTDTAGRGHKWTTLTDTQKKKFIDNPENNIYYDSEADELIQVRYRVRVVEGLGDDWQEYRPTENSKYGLCYSYNNCWINSQNASEVSLDFTRESVNNVYWSPAGFNGKHLTTNGEVSAFEARHTVNGHGAFAVPIALVQRMNQGAYHPTYNPMGCGKFTENTGTGSAFWHHSLLNTPTNTANCFELPSSPYPYTDGYQYISSSTGRSGNITGGALLAGRSDQYKYYDAIYAGQVEDLRLNANKLDVNQLREETMRKAIAGEMRGKGKVPFTQVQQATQGATVGATNAFDGLNTANISVGDKAWLENASNVYERVTITSVVNISGTIGFEPSLSGRLADSMAVLERELSPEFDSLPWVDIIGDPERIAATFPDGVVGQWIPVVPDGDDNTDFPLNRKCNTSTLQSLETINNGDGWIDYTYNVNTVTNEIDAYGPSGNAVGLWIYESPSNFTEPSNSSVVVGGVGNVYATQSRLIDYGNRLQAALTGNIGKREGGAYLQEYVPVTKHTNYAPAGTLGWTSAIGDEPLHTPLSLDTPNDSSPAVKALSTVTEKDGLLYLQLNGAELTYRARTIADMTVITAGSPTGAITKGEVYLLQGFDNGLMNRAMIALTNHAGTTWSASVFNGYTINSLGEIISNSNVKFYLLCTFDSAWGDDRTVPIIDNENTKKDLNDNTVKVFCHHSQIPIGINSNN